MTRISGQKGLEYRANIRVLRRNKIDEFCWIAQNAPDSELAGRYISLL